MKAKGIQLIMLLFILVSLPATVCAQTHGGQRASATNSGTSVRGVVYDADGETLPGVSVRIPKRNIGVVSNYNFHPKYVTFCLRLVKISPTA